MPLPRESSAWPPEQYAPAFDRYRFNDALWLNDTEVLSQIVNGRGTAQAGQAIDTSIHNGIQRRGGIVGLARRFWWGAPVTIGEQRTTMPTPIAGNIASLSKRLLTSEPPIIRLTDQAGKPAKGKAQDRLDLIANSDDFHMTLNEGAELTAAISGSVLKLNWDRETSDAPWIDVVGADVVIPEFQGGRLAAVNLWQTYPGPGNRTFRHIERHEPGAVIHALYLGTDTSVGSRQRLETLDELAYLVNVPGAILSGTTVVLPTGVKGLTVAFWKNLATKTWRKSGTLANLGRSDFEGIEPQLDAYSEAWAALMRDVKLGKARIIVPRSMLQGLGAGQGAAFDEGREVYDGLDYLNPEGSADQIKEIQMHIRWEEHMKVLGGLKLEILDGAGYSAASYGTSDAQGGAMTATEISDRKSKSEGTRDEKALYLKQALSPLLRTAMEIDRIQYPGKGEGNSFEGLDIQFPDVSQVDPEAQARQFMDLRTANAISIRQTIIERRPNWDDDQVDAELKLIQEELDSKDAITDPATFRGDPFADPAAVDPSGAPEGEQKAPVVA